MHTCTCTCDNESMHYDKNHVFVFPSSRNKDHYVGDWVQDRRQGSGELRCTDGTIYDVSHVNYMFLIT